MLNINYGYNAGLMEQCRKLEEYAGFVQAIRQFLSEGIPYKRALNEAVNYCIENHILEEFLRKNRQEVLGMLLEDFDAKKYERTIREEGREEGLEEGAKKEREQGIRILIKTCMELGASKEQIIRKVMQEYSLTREQAEAYYTDISH
jgi:predicted transposase YdaD